MVVRLKVPVSFSLIISTAASALIFKSQVITALVASGRYDLVGALVIQLQDVITNMVKGVDSFSLLSIPFFILDTPPVKFRCSTAETSRPQRNIVTDHTWSR